MYVVAPRPSTQDTMMGGRGGGHINTEINCQAVWRVQNCNSQGHGGVTLGLNVFFNMLRGHVQGKAGSPVSQSHTLFSHPSTLTFSLRCFAALITMSRYVCLWSCQTRVIIHIATRHKDRSF